jgi:fused signal recognition particle receptor
MEMYIAIGVVLLIVLLAIGFALFAPRRRTPTAPPAQPPAAPPETIEAPPLEPEVVEPGTVEPEVVEPPVLERPEPTAGRLVRLRSRLSRSQNALGRGLLAILSRDKLDDDTWDEVEETLISADVGVAATTEIVGRLREQARVLGTSSTSDLRKLLTDELTEALEPGLDRSLRATPTDGKPAVILVVGVNGSGKTTTCGKIARVLVADGHSVLLGAADTFRAAAAEQLSTWAGRVGAEVVRGPEGADPASVAFDAVKRGVETGVDSVLVDTAGRLQNKVGLMDELGKVKRVIERHGPVDETLLVLDATTGQNGLTQARVFTEVVDVTGVVLTKLDGTAKGGIVIAVQKQLGIPVKLVGLGEGADDLAPFEPAQFVDALLGSEA